MARNAIRKLRTLRHPGVIKVLDTVEVRSLEVLCMSFLRTYEQTESYIYIATERVIPLRWHIKRKSMSAETLKWGLFSIAVGSTLILLEEGTDLTQFLVANDQIYQ